MDPSAHLSSILGFLLVAVLAAAVAGATAWRQGMAEADSLTLGSALFLAQLAVLVALANLGTSISAAASGAVVLGTIAVLGLGPVPQREASKHADRTYPGR